MNESQQPPSDEHSEQEIIKNDEKEILRNIMEEQIRQLSNEDQSMQAIRNLGAMIALLYKTLVEADIDEEAATALTQSYVEAVVHTMFLKG